MASTSVPKKRKSDTAPTAAKKKAKLNSASNAALVQNILSDASNFELASTPEETRATILQLAQYARSLEEEVDSYMPKAKSLVELTAAAQKLASAARSGIRNMLLNNYFWKPSCKTGSAKWMYDGVCNDAQVFGTLLGLGGPPTFKTTKMNKDEFENFIGDLDVSIRYDTLRLTSDVNIHWKPAEGTFKFSGSYGK